MPEPFEPNPSLGVSASATDPSLKLRLYVMMFLQYFVQGCYLPIISVYIEDALGFSPWQIGTFGSALAFGALVAPFIIGQLVDRHYATEKVLSASHLIGGVIMLALYGIGTYLAEDYEVFWPVLILGVAYSTLYGPSMMLTNSLTFHHIADRDREFPLIRMWGTIGFIFPAWLVELFFLKGITGDELNTKRGIVLALAGVSGLLMGLYSLTLPKTPPAPSDKKGWAPGKVLGMCRRRDFLSLVLISLLVTIVHKFHFTWNGQYVKAVLRQGGIEGAWEQRISSIGQIFEIGVMVVLGLLIKRLGFKRTLMLGAAAYMARCAVFAGSIVLDAPFPVVMTLVCIGQAFHGLCFGCFLAAAFIYVDRVSPTDVRGSMQNFYGTFVVSLGFFIGGFVAGGVGQLFTNNPGEPSTRSEWGFASTAGMITNVPRAGEQPLVHDWPGIWLSAGAIALLALLLLALFFPREESPAADAGG